MVFFAILSCDGKFQNEKRSEQKHGEILVRDLSVFLLYRDDTIYSIASVSITNFTLPSIPLSFPLNVV